MRVLCLSCSGTARARRSSREIPMQEIGIRGNTHFPFSDTNNVEIANLLSKFLAEQQLDGRAHQ
jgi:hypothetical protein